MKPLSITSLGLLLSLSILTVNCALTSTKSDEETETTPTTVTYTLTYDGNGSTSGMVPTTAKTLSQGQTHTVLGNTGGLQKTGNTYRGWNTAANGTGTDYKAGDTFTMGTANATLYAQWLTSGKVLWGTTPQTAANYSLFVSAATDASGNIYAVGTLFGSGLFAFGNGVTTAGGMNGVDNLVIVKYDSSGKALWARTVTSAASSSAYNSVAVDPSGNVYAAGSLTGSGTYDLGNGKTVTATNGFNCVLLVKYDFSGNTIWAKTVALGPGSTSYRGVAVDPSGAYVYAVGEQYATATYDYGDGATTASYNANSNVLLVKYTSSGTGVWARSTTAASNDSIFYAVAVGSTGNVFASGFQYGTGISYASGVTPSGGASSSSNALLVKYASDGTVTWAQTASPSLSASSDSEFKNLTIDSSGNVYAVGLQNNAAVFTYGIGSTTSAQTSISGSNPLIVKFDHAGNGLWARTVSAGPSGGNAVFYGIVAAASGDVYAAGHQSNAAAYTYGSGVTATSVNSGSNVSCAVLVRYDSSGNAVWARTITGGTSGSYFYGAAADSLANVIAAGCQQNPYTFSYGDGVTLTGASTSGTAATVLKYVQ